MCSLIKWLTNTLTYFIFKFSAFNVDSFPGVLIAYQMQPMINSPVVADVVLGCTLVQSSFSNNDNNQSPVLLNFPRNSVKVIFWAGFTYNNVSEILGSDTQQMAYEFFGSTAWFIGRFHGYALHEWNLLCDCSLVASHFSATAL